MALSLTSLAGLYVLAVSSVLPALQGGGPHTAPTVTETVVIIAPASFPPTGPVSVTRTTVFGKAPPPAEVSRPRVQDSETAGPCRVGMIVMIPDGREGQVTSREGDTCRVLAYGEAFVSLWNEDMIEPVYPQPLPRYTFGH